MRIAIEDKEYEGSPEDILTQLWEESFIWDEFRDASEYLEYLRSTFERVTDIPCALPKGSFDERARALFASLASIDVLEILEEG